MLTACASSPQPPEPAPIPANLRQPCPLPLPLPHDGTGAAVLRTMVEWGQLYRECASRHAELVQAVGNFSPK